MWMIGPFEKKFKSSTNCSYKNVVKPGLSVIMI